MKVDRNIVVQEVKILAAFMAVSIIQTWLMCRSCNSLKSYLPLALFTLFLWILLWRGNSFLADYVSSRISWIDYPGRRFVVGLVVTMGYTFLAVYVLILFFETFMGFDFGTRASFAMMAPVVITLLISLFLHSREFLSSWRKATFESTRFRRASVSAKYETLKSQVNPSFLFHSLNALSKLVHRDEEGAVRYIKQLADTYRYMLDTRDRELVPLAEELTFLEAYGSLLRTRYGLVVAIDKEGNTPGRHIAPLAIHMMIEKLLESGTVPRALDVRLHNGWVIVLLSTDADVRTDAGFADILDKVQKKYSFVSESQVVVENGNGITEIRLPLIRYST